MPFMRSRSAPGFLGALAMLARSVLARPLFVVSLIAIVVQFGWLFTQTDILAHRGVATTLPFPLVIAVIAAVEIWLADLAQRRGWIG